MLLINEIDAPDQRNVLWDVHNRRCAVDVFLFPDDFYTVIEQVKNGMMYDIRYHGTAL